MSSDLEKFSNFVIFKTETAKGLWRNKMTRIGDAILCIDKAKNAAIALAKTRLFNDVNVQKSKSKWIGCFVSIPRVNVEVFFKDDTLWLTQKAMSQLFDKGRSTITEHIKRIFTEGELIEDSVCRDFRPTAENGRFDSNHRTDLG